MGIETKINDRFRGVRGGLFESVAKADVGEGASNFAARGGEIMAWADPFYPDPSLPRSVKETLLKAIEDGYAAHYTAPIGMPQLRETIARVVSKRTGIPINPNRNVIVTPGSDSGLIYSMMPFISDGDEVLVPDPSYPSNFMNPKLLGGKAVPVPLSFKDNYQPKIEEFKTRMSDRTKMVLITHPNNPTTTVFRRENLEILCEFIVENDLILVSDQAFEDHVFDGVEFVSPCTLPGMWERTLTVCSISKGIGLSGLRIGYIVSDDRIMDTLYGGAVNILGAACTLSSLAAVTALEDDTHLARNFEKLEARRRAAHRIFSSTPGVRTAMSESGILSWLDVSALGTSEEVADRIKRGANILVNPGSQYGAQGEGFIRVVTACFTEESDALLRFERISAVLAQIAAERGIA
ncbi:MAG: pyridoxal phosphate-dependent aminotransferase [Synergistaceae bacterium]|jgi:aspartate/methionine/tyrosine aminotransferase|nr:pyridoxal phosphate-dependent aminotransferase [Synergistaceae bacterium]